MENIWYVLKMSIPVYLGFGLLYKIYRGKRKMTFGDYVLEFIFITYIFSVLVIQNILPINISDFKEDNITPNLIPCAKFIASSFKFFHQWFAQVLLFVPFGILYPVIVKEKNKVMRNTIVICAVFSFCIEIMEYHTGRFFNIDDIIFSVLGAIIGYFIFKSVNNIRHKEKKY